MGEQDGRRAAQQVFKHNLKASEKTRELFGSFEQDDAERAILEEFNRLMKVVQDPQRAEDAALLVQRLAQGLDSEMLLEAVAEQAENNEMLQLEKGKQ
jgi:hypothetical protein